MLSSVSGKGNPNEEGGAYQQAISVLYAVAYTLKMSYKTDYKIEGFFEYVVPPLEGFWWQDNVAGVDYSNKDNFNWISVISLPDFITKNDFNDERLHHEIYLSDARKVVPEKWKTVIRHPIKKK